MIYYNWNEILKIPRWIIFISIRFRSRIWIRSLRSLTLIKRTSDKSILSGKKKGQFPRILGSSFPRESSNRAWQHQGEEGLKEGEKAVMDGKGEKEKKEESEVDGDAFPSMEDWIIQKRLAQRFSNGERPLVLAAAIPGLIPRLRINAYY